MVNKSQILYYQLNKFLRKIFNETISDYHKFFRDNLPMFYIDDYKKYENYINPDVTGNYMD